MNIYSFGVSNLKSSGGAVALVLSEGEARDAQRCEIELNFQKKRAFVSFYLLTPSF